MPHREELDLQSRPRARYVAHRQEQQPHHRHRDHPNENATATSTDSISTEFSTGTIPGKGWFVYFRIYGPRAPAFDGSWKPGDFEKVQ